MSTPQNLSLWFLNALAEYRAGKPSLPNPPFALSRAIAITGDAYYEDLEVSVKTTIAHQNGDVMFPCPRFATEALQKDLRRLFKYTMETANAID